MRLVSGCGASCRARFLCVLGEVVGEGEVGCLESGMGRGAGIALEIGLGVGVGIGIEEAVELWVKMVDGGNMRMVVVLVAG